MLSILVVLADISALLRIVAGVLALAGAGMLMGTDLGALLVVIMVMGVVMIVISLGIIIVGHFLWKGFNWARITFIVLIALTIAGTSSVCSGPA